MALTEKLPISPGNWDHINDFLSVSHNPDGTLVSAGSGRGPALMRGPFTFFWNTPGLTAGVAFYTPQVGEVIFAGALHEPVRFNGTTPRFDIGLFTGGDTRGLYDGAGVNTGGGYLGNPSPSTLLGLGYMTPGLGEYGPFFKFLTTSPLKIVISQTGAVGGAAVGGSTGQADYYIVTSLPL